MAAEKQLSKDAKSTAKPVKEKKGNIFSRFFNSIGKAYYNMYHELKKDTWPTKSALIN